MKTVYAILMVSLLASPTCFGVEPTKAAARTACTIKCRVDSAGNVICKEICR